MANAIKLEIQKPNGKWQIWKNVAIPVKFGNLLDEQLDYATINLMRIKKREFKPLTRARLTITDKHDNVEIINYFIANDDFYEAPVGSGAYNHELTLIELTKLLECFPLETLCFTNPNGNNYTREAVAPVISYNSDRIDAFPSNYLTPSATGTRYALFNFNKDLVNPSGSLVSISYVGHIKVEAGNNVTIYSIDAYGEIVGDNTFVIQEGENVITYYSDIKTVSSEGEFFRGEQTSTFTIYGVENRYPLKPWTVNDVIQRVLQLVEPLIAGQKQRFTFIPPEDKASVFERIAPEFTFTRQTLREALQTIGGFIHAEPRLNVDDSNNFYITFDFYGEQEYATYASKSGRKRLSAYKYKTLRSNYGIEQATTKLDSYQDNLVNRISWEQATIGQPYKGGVQTLRTETAYIRGEEQDSFHFPSTHNIDRVVKFEYIYNGKGYDITPYVFEKSVYNYLSSYDEHYPNSKSYALYYTNGGKGINGFFYKVPSELGGNVGKQYSIVNIIERVVGIQLSNHYNDMQFRLTYVPIYSTRVQQSKAYLKDYLPLPRILNYTQSDNSVEARFFGENIKGAISRMGNVEQTYTINLRNVTNIPKAGQLWDDDYYIASVSVSVNSDLFEASVGLSKNFNRKSQYIGASSYKRMYEISETMAQERHTVYTDYIVITNTFDATLLDNTGVLLRESGLQAISSIFIDGAVNNSIVAVEAYGSNKKGDILQEKVLLPVIASAFGNAMEFTWEYKDNFSAGIRNEDKSSGEVTGTFGVEVDYADYYGRIYYYYFSLLTESQVGEYDVSVNDLPELKSTKTVLGMAGAVRGYDLPLVERKDNREIPKKSYVIEFVTDDNNFVIGSAFAGLNPLVRHDENRRQPHLYLLPYRVNKFATHIDLTASGVQDLGAVDVNIAVENYIPFFKISAKTATQSGMAWAYAIPPYEEDNGPVEDEDGNVTSSFIIQKGGDLILAKNGNFEKNSEVGNFQAGLVHDVYKYLEKVNK